MFLFLCTKLFQKGDTIQGGGALFKEMRYFSYFKHQILSSICSEAILKHNWRNWLCKKQNIVISEGNFFNNMQIGILCLKRQKL